ncbi:MAG: PilN domain-containing protein [Candidatus Omnitrophica bacterium]|nr:PilN domain-containing protein [Candidatus Omnitrophota bacterium]
MIEINLLPEGLKVKKAGLKSVFRKEHAVYIVFLIIGLLLLTHVYLAFLGIAKSIQLSVLTGKWQSLEPQRKEFEKFNEQFVLSSQSNVVIGQLVQKRLSWAAKLNKLSLDLPKGVWFNEIVLSPKELIINGSVISLEKEEMNLVNKFIENLKNDPGFINDFTGVELGNVVRKSLGGYDIFDFTITAGLKEK